MQMTEPRKEGRESGTLPSFLLETYASNEPTKALYVFHFSCSNPKVLLSSTVFLLVAYYQYLNGGLGKRGRIFQVFVGVILLVIIDELDKNMFQ